MPSGLLAAATLLYELRAHSRAQHIIAREDGNSIAWCVDGEMTGGSAYRPRWVAEHVEGRCRRAEKYNIYNECVVGRCRGAEI